MIVISPLDPYQEVEGAAVATEAVGPIWTPCSMGLEAARPHRLAFPALGFLKGTTRVGQEGSVGMGGGPKRTHEMVDYGVEARLGCSIGCSIPNT